MLIIPMINRTKLGSYCILMSEAETLGLNVQRFSSLRLLWLSKRNNNDWQ